MPDWLELQERLVRGDRLACLELNRLVTAILRQLRAYDFRDEWDDLRQEVAMAVIANARKGRLRDPQAFVGYVRIITRNKFVDRLKSQLRRREHEVFPWDEETARALVERAAAPDDTEARELWAEVARLPEEERGLVLGVYREGRTYEEMAERSGVPLGTLKRRLRTALASLRRRLVEPTGGG
jgi:RNA polymerase sigma-70 factor (ECF subfamily)